MPDTALGVMIAPVRQVEGLVLGCLIDASTGMVLESVRPEESLDVPVAAAGAVDLAGVISLMSAELAAEGGLEDVVVTLKGQYHLIRQVSPAPRLTFLLLVVLDRPATNLAMALRQLRDLDLGFPAPPAPAV